MSTAPWVHAMYGAAGFAVGQQVFGFAPPTPWWVVLAIAIIADVAVVLYRRAFTA